MVCYYYHHDNNCDSYYYWKGRKKRRRRRSGLSITEHQVTLGKLSTGEDREKANKAFLEEVAGS